MALTVNVTALAADKANSDLTVPVIKTDGPPTGGSSASDAPTKPSSAVDEGDEFAAFDDEFASISIKPVTGTTPIATSPLPSAEAKNWTGGSCRQHLFRLNRQADDSAKLNAARDAIDILDEKDSWLSEVSWEASV